MLPALSSTDPAPTRVLPPVARGAASDRVEWRVLGAYAAPIPGLASPLFFVQFFFLKYATDVLMIAPAAVLQASGFEPNVDQAPPAHMAIRLLNSALPLGVFLLGALVFTRFSFDHAEHARVRAELARRRSEAP